ncbi:hypothetical protein [Pseudomonas putida]|uniref:hypothetical protein n=1 Tax=Pseudomonas putida TaxID=303 RepID=UPI0020C59A43|nr:hypothetical protein [Pseudomonas putida]UTL80426.1 hypothetical protein NL778_20975 [Pseudomonas putida]
MVQAFVVFGTRNQQSWPTLFKPEGIAMRWRSLDWKFFLTLSVAVLSIVVPLAWQSDIGSKGMELQLKSSASLAPASQIRDLQLMLDGKKLNSPYSSNLELVNTGAKSVLTKDFDRPIEISLNEGAEIITARVTSTTPSDIPIDISATARTVQIAPLLSNPGDSVSLSIITSGVKPVFAVRARIAGIQQISYADLTLPKSPYVRYMKPIGSGLSAWALFSVNIIFLAAFWRNKELRVPRIVSASVILASYTGGVQLLMVMVDGFELRTRWEILIPLTLVAAAASVILCALALSHWYKLADKHLTNAPQIPRVADGIRISDLRHGRGDS